MNIFILLIPISMSVVFINYLFAKMGVVSLFEIVKWSIIVLPLQLIIGIGFAIYYAYGIKYYSYATLSIAAIPTTIALSILVSVFLFKNHYFNIFEIIGVILTFLGLLFLILGKSQIACKVGF
jgi:hypothetical protein